MYTNLFLFICIFSSCFSTIHANIKGTIGMEVVRDYFLTVQSEAQNTRLCSISINTDPWSSTVQQGFLYSKTLQSWPRPLCWLSTHLSGISSVYFDLKHMQVKRYLLPCFVLGNGPTKLKTSQLRGTSITGSGF